MPCGLSLNWPSTGVKAPKKSLKLPKFNPSHYAFWRSSSANSKAAVWWNPNGGFMVDIPLTRSADKISVGDVLRFMDKPVTAEHCGACVSKSNCPFSGNCAFASMWNRVNEAIFDIYDSTTIQDLLNNEKRIHRRKPEAG